MTGVVEGPGLLLATATPGKRFYELDSLRGLAALSVVFYHYQRLRFPQGEYREGRLGDIALTLLRPLYGGHEAVILFFILSGFVLALPYLGHKGNSYPAFLCRRILRIYFPYLCALAPAIAGAFLWHRSPSYMGGSMWTKSPTLSLVLQHVLFLGSYDKSQFSPPIWSLIEEMRISLIFPLLFLLVNRMKGAASVFLAISGTFVVILTSVLFAQFGMRQTVPTVFHYLSFFAVGILLAKHEAAIGAFFRSLRTGHQRTFVAVSLVLFSYGAIPPLLDAVGKHIFQSPDLITDWTAAIGGAGLIVIALHSDAARRFLLKKASLFLGHISYSLYLIHLTVLMVILSVTEGKIPVAIELPLYLGSSLLSATGFYFLVERPFTRLSQRVGRAMDLQRTEATRLGFLGLH